MKVHIPTPCSVPLTDMTPTREGYYCDSCAHTVTDFRSMNEDEIKNYFKNKTGKTCGIFYPKQLEKEERPSITTNINFFKLSYAQKFLCALVICFNAWLFTGCNPIDEPSVLLGEPKMGAVAEPITGDTVCSPLVGILETTPVDSPSSEIRHDENATLKGNVKIDSTYYNK